MLPSPKSLPQKLMVMSRESIMGLGTTNELLLVRFNFTALESAATPSTNVGELEPKPWTAFSVASLKSLSNL